MARKVKCFFMLMIVLCLIYVQQSFVTYAGAEEADTVQKKEERNIAAAKERETPEGEEKPPEEREETPPSEGEEKPPEEGKEIPPSEGEEKPPKEEEETPPEEEQKTIEKYELDIPKENGAHNYYTKKPEINICHISEVGVTKYRLKHGDKILEEKTLKEKGEKAVIESKTFSEGKNVLHIWMEDEKGEKLEKYDTKKELLIDTKSPEIQMSVPRGFDTWYQGQVILSVDGEDSESGLTKISCKVGGDFLGSTGKKHGEFVVAQPSMNGRGVEVTVIAEDKAGNKSERIKTVYIDKEAPKVTIKGAENYKITSKTVNIVYEIEEENMLQEFYVQTVWENVKGKKKQLSSSDWKSDGTKKQCVQKLGKDGIYYIKVQAKDMSGHISSQKIQIIIDKTNPVIRYVEALNGKYLKKFQWTYPPRQMIQDFTTYTYEMRIDGQLYHIGKTVDLEGKHKMSVKAVDAAGNKAQATAEFVIDHTAPEIIFTNVEEGKEYEEERTFTVKLAGEDDTICQIQINGKSQKIDSRKKIYEYTMHKCKDYEVVVRAKDKAGNEAEKTMYFRIIPKETLSKKITGPIKSYFGKDSKINREIYKKEKNEPDSETDKEKLLAKVAGIGMAGVLVLLLGMLCYGIFNKNREKREEDDGKRIP